MDWISPLENGGSHRIWPLHADYIFFDKDNYFYLLSFHTAIGALILFCLFCGHDTFYILAIHHACGMLSVVRYNNTIFVLKVPLEIMFLGLIILKYCL